MKPRVKEAIDRMAAQRFPSDELLADIQRDHVPRWTLAAASEPPVIPIACPNPPSRTRRRVLVAAGLTAVAIAGSAVALPRLAAPPAYADTPSMLHYTPFASKESAMDALTQLADRARRTPVPLGAGAVHYIQTRNWYLGTAMTTDMRILNTRVAETLRDEWIAADGSGRILDVRDGQPARWSGPHGSEPGHSFIVGRTVEELRAQLSQGYGGRSTAGWFKATREIWNQQVVTPELQSALLTILAAQPDVTVEGTTTDRAGRSGIAVSTTTKNSGELTPEMRFTLILNPDTGMLEAYEQIALQAGTLPIHVPATTGYTLWLRQGYTPDTTHRP